MGDAESTVKRFYVQTLEPGVGKKWFNLPEKTFLVLHRRLLKAKNAIKRLDDKLSNHLSLGPAERGQKLYKTSRPTI